MEHMTQSVETAGGTTGTPSKSDAAKGRQYHDHLVANLVKVIRQLQEMK
jgi:creatinine amidohydrolase